MVSKKGTISYRNICRVCNFKQRQEKANSSPLLFLKRNYSQLKSARKIAGEMLWELSWHDVVEKWIGCSGRCEVSNVEMTYHRDGTGKKSYTNVSIDRIDNNIGYNKKNIRLVCWAVNIMKHNMSDEELMLWVSRIHEANRS